MTAVTSTPEVSLDEPPASVRPTARQRCLAGVAALAAFLTMYVALAGPVAFLHRIIPLQPFRAAIEILYAPVVFVVEHRVEPLATVLKAWIGLFT